MATPVPAISYAAPPSRAGPAKAVRRSLLLAASAALAAYAAGDLFSGLLYGGDSYPAR